MLLVVTFRILGKVTQAMALLGLLLGVLYVIGWLLSLAHHPSPFLVNCGILALPVLFVGLFSWYLCVLLEQLLLRRARRRAQSSPPAA